jgi:hypothetical protein
MLRKVRTSTINPRTPTLAKVGYIITVPMISAATSSSRPSRIAWPRRRRYDA